MVGFYFYLFIEKVLILLPRTFRKAFFIGLADLAYLIDKKHRRVILQNLHFALDNSCTPQEEEQISRYCYRNLLLALLQVMESRYLSKKELGEMVDFKHRNILEDALQSDRPIIFISAHYGNWELGATALSAGFAPTVAIYKRLNNPYFEKYLLDARSRFDMKMVEKRGAIKHLTRAVKKGTAISLMIDQNTNKRDGIIVKFFGKDARQTAAPAFLARKYDALIIPLFMTDPDAKRPVITFYEPIEVEKTDDAAADILKATQAQADLLEKVIRDEPKGWFWCHRRWKTEHPEIYR